MDGRVTVWNAEWVTDFGWFAALSRGQDRRVGFGPEQRTGVHSTYGCATLDSGWNSARGGDSLFPEEHEEA